MSFIGQVCLHIRGICYSDKAPQCNRMTATGQDTDNKRTIYKYTNRQCIKYATDIYTSSVARNGTLGVHQKNWVCHIYCQINVQKNQTLRNRTDWADIATHNSGSLRAPPDSSCAPRSSTGYFFFCDCTQSKKNLNIKLVAYYNDQR